MAKFVDGGGVNRELRLTVGLIEDIQAEYGIDADKAFLDGDQLGALLYGGSRTLAAVLATLCGLAGDDATAFKRSLDAAALGRGREALLVELANFSLPPQATAEYLKTIPNLLAGESASSSGPTASAG